MNYYFNFRQYSKIIKKVIFFIIFLSITNRAYGDVYTVDGIILKEKFANTKDFRLNLIDKGIIDSFKFLSQRLIIEKEYWKIKNIESSKIKETILKVNVLDEKKVGSEYQVNLSINYDKNKIKQFFNQRNISYTDIVSEPVMVFPIIKKNENIFIWNDNFILNNWNNTKFKNFLVEYLLPEGDLTDRKNLLLNNFNIKFIDEKNVIKKYGLTNSLVLLVDLDSIENNISYKLNLAGIHYFRAISKKIDKNNLESSLINIIDEIKLFSENVWKNKNAIISSTALSIEFTSQIKNLNQLNNLRKTINNTAGVSELKNLEISSKLFKGKIYFTSSIEDLKKNLEYKKIILKETVNNWIIIYND